MTHVLVTVLEVISVCLAVFVCACMTLSVYVAAFVLVCADIFGFVVPFVCVVAFAFLISVVPQLLTEFYQKAWLPAGHQYIPLLQQCGLLVHPCLYL